MYNKKKVLRDLCDLEYKNGLHVGRWEIEELMDESAEKYLNDMIIFCKAYNVEFDENLENYKEDDDELECFTKDCMGYCLYELVINKMIDILLDRRPESKRI